MPGFFRPTSKSGASSSERHLRPRLPMALLVATVAVGLISPQPVAARPAAQWQTSTIVGMGVPNPLDLCVGERRKIAVSVKTTTYGLSGGLSGSSSYSPNQRIIADGGGRAIPTASGYQGPGGSGDRQVGLTQPYDGTGSGSAATFEIYGSSEGTQEITFMDGGDNEIDRQHDRPRAADKILRVRVHQCEVQFIYFNSWLVPDGFIYPRMTSTFSVTVRPNATGEFPPTEVQVENELHPTAAPGGGLCTYRAVAFTSKAHLTGEIDWNADSPQDAIHFDFVFDDPKGHYDWKCKSYYVPVEVHPDLDGQLTHYEEWGPADAFSTVQDQTLFAGRNVTFPGVMVVLLKQLPIPPIVDREFIQSSKDSPF